MLNLYTDPLAEVAALRRLTHHFHPKQEIEFPKMTPPLFYRKKTKVVNLPKILNTMGFTRDSRSHIIWHIYMTGTTPPPTTTIKVKERQLIYNISVDTWWQAPYPSASPWLAALASRTRPLTGHKSAALKHGG